MGTEVEINVLGLDKLKLLIGENSKEIDVPTLLSIQDDSIELLQEQVAKSPALIEYYSSVKAWYEYELDEIRCDLERTYAELDKDNRKSAGDNKLDVKERFFKSVVETDSLIIAAKSKLNQYSYIVGRLSSLVRALERRDDRLCQIYSRYKGLENRANG